MRNLITILFLLLIYSPKELDAQGYNHTWLLGYWPTGYYNGRMTFDSSSYNYQKEFRKMGFEGTEATLCDRNGNFLMSSNGVWIANATNDTMLNGGGLNPGRHVNSNPNGALIQFGNLLLPFISDTNKIYLLHQTGSPNNDVPSIELFYSEINLALDNGLGGVIQKNQIVLQDTLSWGITACKHANGRDWWIIVFKDSSDLFYKILLTPMGIHSITTQHTGIIPSVGNVTEPVFSNNGLNFSINGYNKINGLINSYIFIFEFDRCNGVFANQRTVNVSQGSYLWGNTFSPSGNYIYANTSNYVFQIDVNTLQVDTVATYDGFCFPNSPWCTTFWNEYLAANGKIYITSGSGVQHIHEMNYPDSAGIACDVQQHAIFLDMWNFRAVPNHPNYNLGPVLGSVCDSLSVGTAEYYQQIQNFQLFPNPLKDGVLKISYQLPQNLAGEFEVYDLNAKLQYHQYLPPWSSLQYINLPLLTNGMYQCVIRSGKSIVSKKLVVVR